MVGRDAYVAVTRGIRVSVRTYYLADQSSEEEGRHVWAYRVEIENGGRETVQLLKRSWLITDAMARTQRVHGDGVVGEQPVLEPDESFEYTSGTPLPTPSGIMRGAYHMMTVSCSETFDVEVPAFSLDVPQGRAVLN